MSVFAQLTSETVDSLESEDALGAEDFMEFIHDDLDSIPPYEPLSKGADHSGLLSSMPNSTLNQTISNAASSPESPNSSYPDSSSDSSSSKQTASSVSTKAGCANGDAMMDDMDMATDWKDWKVEDFVNTEDEQSRFLDGTIDPSSIENNFSLEGLLDGPFGLTSPSSTTSPCANRSLDAVSPPTPSILPPRTGKLTHNAKVSTPNPRHNPRGHKKAGSMARSREVSPMSNNVAYSQNSSPSGAMFQNSPSSPVARAGFDFVMAPNMRLHHDGRLVSPDFSFQNGLAMGNGAGQGFPHQGMPMPMPVGAAPFVMYKQQQSPHGGHPFYELTIDKTPLKSRVETQIPVRLKLSPLPPGIKRLHLPTHTISKPKLVAKPRPERSPDMLELSVMLVCTSAMQNPEFQRRALDRAAAAAVPPSTDGSARAPVAGDGDEPKPQDGGEVRICSGCVTRERKRAARKKAKKPEEEESWIRDENRRVVVFNTHEVKEWGEPKSSSSLSNSNALGHPQPIQEGEIDAPMRIACYCRHHGEKAGFQVIFTLKDHLGKIMAQSFSDSIMITDDHKTHTLPPGITAGGSNDGGLADGVVLSGPDASLLHGSGLSPAAPPDSNTLSPGASFRGSHSTSDLPALKRSITGTCPATTNSAQPTPSGSASHTPRNLSRPVSPTGVSGPSTKKRKSSSGITKVPSTLTMTKLETTSPQLATHPSAPSAAGSQITSAVSVSTVPSPFSPSLGSFSPSAEPLLFGSVNPGTADGMPFNHGPPTPNNHEVAFLPTNRRSGSLDNLAMAAPLFSAPPSAHPSRAPSPNSLRSSAATIMQHHQHQPQPQQHSSQFDRGLAGLTNTGNLFPSLAMQRSAPAVIHKIIPNEGPKSGGIEVTILGGGFFQGLEVMFGGQRATTTTFWGDTSLVCLLPPSPVAGAVIVSFMQNGQPTQCFNSATKQQPVFKYVDDDEQQLMRTALSVLGHKMTGKIEDVRELARRIINNGGDVGGGGSGSGSGGGINGFSGFSTAASNSATLETQLLNVLDLIDLDDSTHKPRLNLQRRTGQTMLHLACSLGLHRLVAGLLVRGANPDARDKGGYTPLHMAALNNHHEIVRRLIYAGADPTIRTLSGLTAANLSRSREVLKAIRRLERHARSRSGDNLHSRVSSATSLRSLWEPPSTRVVAREYTSEESELTSSGESPEYSEIASQEEDGGAGSDGDGDGGGPWLDMRRPSIRNAAASDSVSSSLMSSDGGNASAQLQPPVPHEPGSPVSPSAAMTAFREQMNAFSTQFQHMQRNMQQAMAMHLPNLPQFNYFSQMANFPGMPELSEYQAQMIQRISSFVPNIGGSSNGSNDGNSRPGSSASDNEQQPSRQTGRPHPPSQSKDLDGKWWAPPPAYEDIFPDKDKERGDADVKQASAARAAAEAEADSKCARLYDDDNRGTSSSTTVAEEPKSLPALLQIGRKNAITKEQQDNLRRAHAENYKGLRSDRNLYMIWIPVLLIVLCATLYDKIPTVMSIVSCLYSSIGGAANLAAAAAAAPVAVIAPQDRVVEVL